MRALILLLMMTATAHAAPILITKPVGQVGDLQFTARATPVRYISTREVQLHFAIATARDTRTQVVTIDPLPLKSIAFPPELVATLKDYVVALETESFSVNEVSASEIDKLIAATTELIGRSPFYKTFEYSDKEIKDGVTRFLKARAFVQFKQSSVPQVSDTDAQKYFDDNRAKFGEGTIDDFREMIKNTLSRQIAAQRLQDWYQTLFRKYSARSYLQDL